MQKQKCSTGVKAPELVPSLSVASPTTPSVLSSTLKLGDMVTLWLPHPDGLSALSLFSSLQVSSEGRNMSCSSSLHVKSAVCSSVRDTRPMPIVPLSQCLSEFSTVEAIPSARLLGQERAYEAAQAAAAAANEHSSPQDCKLRFLRIQCTLMEIRAYSESLSPSPPCQASGDQSSGVRLHQALRPLSESEILASETRTVRSIRCGALAQAKSELLLAYVRFRQENDNRNGAWVPVSLLTSRSSSASAPQQIVDLWREVKCAAAAAAAPRVASRGAMASEQQKGLCLPAQAGSSVVALTASPTTGSNALLLPLNASGPIVSRVHYDPTISSEIGEAYVELSRRAEEEPSGSTGVTVMHGCGGGTSPSMLSSSGDGCPSIPIAMYAPSLRGALGSLPSIDSNPPNAAKRERCVRSVAGAVLAGVHPIFAATANYLSECQEKRTAVDFLEGRLGRDFRSPVNQCHFFLYLMTPDERPRDESDGVEEGQIRSQSFVEGFAFTPWYYSPVRLFYGGSHQTGPYVPSDGIAEKMLHRVFNTAELQRLCYARTNDYPTAASDSEDLGAVLAAMSPSMLMELMKSVQTETDHEDVSLSTQRAADVQGGSNLRSLLPSLISAAAASAQSPNRSRLLDLHICPFTLRLFSCIDQHHRAVSKMMDLRLCRIMSIQNHNRVPDPLSSQSSSANPHASPNALLSCAYPLCPPGIEIYRDTHRGVSAYYVCGEDHRAYVRNVFLITKSFLENKLAGHDVGMYNVYAVCLHTRVHFPRYHAWLVDRAVRAIERREVASRESQRGLDSTTFSETATKSAAVLARRRRKLAEAMVLNSNVFAGFYSTEEGGVSGGFNLACIMSLPCFGWNTSAASGAGKRKEAATTQRYGGLHHQSESASPTAINTSARQVSGDVASTPGNGIGTFIIRLSYEVAYRKGFIGTPERPLSDLGERAYVSFWRSALLAWMRSVAARRGEVTGGDAFSDGAGLSGVQKKKAGPAGDESNRNAATNEGSNESGSMSTAGISVIGGVGGIGVGGGHKKSGAVSKGALYARGRGGDASVDDELRRRKRRRRRTGNTEEGVSVADSGGSTGTDDDDDDDDAEDRSRSNSSSSTHSESAASKNRNNETVKDRAVTRVLGQKSNRVVDVEGGGAAVNGNSGGAETHGEIVRIDCDDDDNDNDDSGKAALGKFDTCPAATRDLIQKGYANASSLPFLLSSNNGRSCGQKLDSSSQRLRGGEQQHCDVPPSLSSASHNAHNSSMMAPPPIIRCTLETIAKWAGLEPKDALAALTDMGVLHYAAASSGGGSGGYFGTGSSFHNRSSGDSRGKHGNANSTLASNSSGGGGGTVLTLMIPCDILSPPPSSTGATSTVPAAAEGPAVRGGQRMPSTTAQPAGQVATPHNSNNHAPAPTTGFSPYDPLVFDPRCFLL